MVPIVIALVSRQHAINVPVVSFDDAWQVCMKFVTVTEERTKQQSTTLKNKVLKIQVSHVIILHSTPKTANGILTTLAIDHNHVLVYAGITGTASNLGGAAADEALTIFSVGASSSIATGYSGTRGHTLSVHHDEVTCFTGDSRKRVWALAKETAHLFDACSIIHTWVAGTKNNLILAATAGKSWLTCADNLVPNILTYPIILTWRVSDAFANCEAQMMDKKS